MATWSSSSSAHLIHNLLRLPEPQSPVCLFLRPLCLFSASVSQSSHHSKLRWQSKTLLPFHSNSPFVAKSYSSIDEPDLGEDEDEDYSAEEYEDAEEEQEDDELDSGMVTVRGIEDVSEMDLGDKEEEKTEKTKKKAGRGGGSALKLTIKEKKELASYAHSLGDKLKCQLVGKSGVTDSVVFSFLETLEKNELLKVKIRKTSPEELEDAVTHLEDATGSVAVGQIGRTVILYRPSPTKMKAEEKKKKKEVERLSITRRQNFSNSRPFASSSNTEHRSTACLGLFPCLFNLSFFSL